MQTAWTGQGPQQLVAAFLQVKNFGRRGRTKWTHLVNEDTTEFDNEIAPTADIRKKFVGKTAGTQDVFENPPRPVR